MTRRGKLRRIKLADAVAKFAKNRKAGTALCVVKLMELVIAVDEKQCTKCKEFQSFEYFAKKTGSKTGLTSWCKWCLNGPNWVPKPPAVEKPTKRCERCEEIKPLDRFPSKGDEPDGRNKQCGPCWNATKREERERQARERDRFLRPPADREELMTGFISAAPRDRDRDGRSWP